MKLIAVSVYGEDKPGIVHEISKTFAEFGANIVDIEQNVLQGMFVMFVVAELPEPDLEGEIKKRLDEIAGKIGVNVSVSPFERKKIGDKNLYVVTIIGRDRVGIVREVTSVFLEFEINIEKTTLTAREELISIEFLVDIGESDPEDIRRRLRLEAEKLNLDIVFQPYAAFEREKRLIVFDMDSTLVDAEIIDELAKEAGVEGEVSELTEKAMRGEMSFKEALEERVKLLRGLPVDVLERIYSRIRLTDGAKELIRGLKNAGYKVAVVSGGFSYFTNRIKEELGLDYAFGNELEIRDGRLTGRLKGRIIDAAEKARIVEEIAKKEGISPANIVAVGDGANDRLMIERAGLGIAFNAKEALKEVADGSISKENLIGLASLLKLPAEFRKRI